MRVPIRFLFQKLKPEKKRKIISSQIRISFILEQYNEM